MRQGSTLHTIEVQPGDTVQAAMDQIEGLTGILARKQKLIFKGKVLTATMTLEEAKLKNESLLMLVAAAGQMTQVSSFPPAEPLND